MNIQQMHQAFRTLGQQLGLQLNRGILPESIDVYLNQVITEKVQEELLTGVRTALQDSVNTQAQAVSPINMFRTLYRTSRYKIDVTNAGSGNNKCAYYSSLNGFHIINIPTIGSTITIEDASIDPFYVEYKISPMMYLGFSVEYENTLRGNPIACRLIGSDVIETTLRDYCNGASKDSPIACLRSATSIDENFNERLDDSSYYDTVEIYINTKDTDIKYLNIHYIKTPNVVKYDIDLDNCVNCDLPAYTHFNIVERAVSKYYQSIGATTANNNNYRRQQQD